MWAPQAFVQASYSSEISTKIKESLDFMYYFYKKCPMQG